MGRRVTLAGLLTLALAAPASAQLPGLPNLPRPPGSDPPPQGNQPPPPPGGPAGSPVTGSVTSHVDHARTNYVNDPNVVPPLTRRWTRRFEGVVVGTLAAEGRVYVLTAAPESRAARLHAVDPSTGRDLWVRVAGMAREVAYDAGRLFVTADGDGVTAHSAADGALLWSGAPPDGAGGLFAPVASDGVVYVRSLFDLFALRSSDGQVTWTAKLESGGPMTLDRGRVFAPVGCRHAYAFARADGRRLWTREGDCSSDPTLHLAADRLHVAQDGAVLDAATGAQVGAFPARSVPILTSDTSVTGEFDRWRATDLASGAVRWETRCRPARDQGRGFQASGGPSASTGPCIA